MTDQTSGAQSGNGAVPTIQVAGQYVKDLSFENPLAPNPPTGKPQMQVGVDVQARALGNEQFEVALRIRVDAKADTTQVFLAELVYAGHFVIRGVPQDSIQPFLLIECPRLLFPFARRIIADTTRDGGFMPLMLDPIDFAQLYRQQAMAQARGPEAPRSVS